MLRCSSRAGVLAPLGPKRHHLRHLLVHPAAPPHQQHSSAAPEHNPENKDGSAPPDGNGQPAHDTHQAADAAHGDSSTHHGHSGFEAAEHQVTHR